MQSLGSMVYGPVMPTFDATHADVLVYTYKEGLLSAIAHDLKLRLTELELGVVLAETGEARPTGAPGVASIRLRANPRSLRVVCAMHKGRENHGALSARDVRDIEDNITRDVLHPSRFDLLTYDSTAIAAAGTERYRVRGELLLHGVRRPVETVVAGQASHWVAETTLLQPDFDIEPFSAMLGSMKIKPEVRVVVKVPKM